MSRKGACSFLIAFSLITTESRSENCNERHERFQVVVYHYEESQSINFNSRYDSFDIFF